MDELSKMNPTGRFTGLADVYAQHRPDYPTEAIDAIMKQCGLGQNSLLVDVGCGTGTSSLLFARRGVAVVGIEPNEDMRRRAAAVAIPESCPTPQYRQGRAEATGLADRSADAVLAAQAFHWFEPDKALREFHRLLKAGGWVILMWNERDESDGFTAAFGTVMRWSKEAERLEDLRRQAGAPLLISPLFRGSHRLSFGHEQVLDEDGTVGRAVSASYAPTAPDEVEAFQEALRRLFHKHQSQGRVTLRYTTSVYLGQRA
jgi:SAM-dependent methyltransferase